LCNSIQHSGCIRRYSYNIIKEQTTLKDNCQCFASKFASLASL
jgi:hypothetical protein